ncbi:MAG: hypothetical protein Q8L10_02160 [Candidatus Moranbacteria bacterium]|nr:hypothetical protein [Candidatus Moranbacteria bacterium]
MLKKKIFWGISIALAAIIFIVAMNANKAYRAQIWLLFLPKTENAVRNIDQIIANAQEIPLALSFYDKLLQKNPYILDDVTADLPAAERKELWNSRIETERIGKSGVIGLVAFGASQTEAESLDRLVVSDLLVVLSNYYNIKTDLDIRIIDGPISSEVIRMDGWLWALISLVAGAIIGFLLSVFFAILGETGLGKAGRPEPIGSQEMKKAVAAELPKVSFTETRAEKKEPAVEVKDIFDFAVEKEASLMRFRKEPVTAEKKAAAPSNLPVSEEEFTFNISPEADLPVPPTAGSEETRPVEEMIASASASDTAREATPEEVKERLNKLLKGDI